MRVRSIRNMGQAPAPSLALPETSILPASLSERDAARYIGMSAAWLKKSRTRRFRSRADAPRYVKAGARRIVYRRVDLDEWQLCHTTSVGSSAAS
jgi:predicted DNA-binding transcriptional regulator AlpA